MPETPQVKPSLLRSTEAGTASFCYRAKGAPLQDDPFIRFLFLAFLRFSVTNCTSLKTIRVKASPEVLDGVAGLDFVEIVCL